ncbi:MFS transporter [Gimesia aquarii]|uniref:Major Facilitator Superfamily protein n=1 Tax=Gimesia aquarii TaxID=2527964 RepID=A0A517WWT0_9PLAN|nr:MFS transporter [Gimesia aquarii]QDU09694.1 Major Facilitator Superfamily protein [Gimesia aquarii]
MWSQKVAQRAIIIAGCLAMVYTQLTMSPATIQFARSLGATGWHIGLLGALPTLMLFMQFVAAILANHLHYRRWTWFSFSILQRLMLIPIAAGPWFFLSFSDQTWLWCLIALTAMNHALIHFTTPLWLSWMGDYLPHTGLNRYWGIRQLWMYWSGALSLLGGAFFLSESGLDIRQGFAILVCIGGLFGIIDILIFLKVDEPPVTKMKEPKLKEVLLIPFKNKRYRSFIFFTCFWHFAAMVGSPFISFYLLDYIGMDVFLLLLLWTCSWVGGAIFSKRLGHMAEHFGNRPTLILCTAFKSTNMLGLLLLPQDPIVAFWIMVPIFIFDSLLNAGIAIANNGFMLKNSPAENRTMFIAAGTAVAGMVGGLTSILTGAFLAITSGWSIALGEIEINHFHIIFAISLVLRLAAAVFARTIREPESHWTVQIVVQLVGVTPLRILRFPVGLYRSFRSDEDTLLSRKKCRTRKKRWDSEKEK